MENFVFKLPTKIIFGKGEFNKLGTEASKLGKKALIVTGKHFAKQTGLLDNAIEQLKTNNVDFVTFSEIEPNPESETIDKGAEVARKENIDILIAIGGGSVLDASKAISLVAKTGIPIWEYCKRTTKIKMPDKIYPILTAVTFAATGSEADGNAVITNTKTREKRGIFGEALFPAVSIVDPLLTLSVPKRATVDGVVDMFVHILESYLSSKSHAPVSDRISEALMKEAMKSGEIVFNDLRNLEARESLSWISTLALSGFPSAGRRGPFPIHRLGHPLSGVYGIAHGRTLACILPSFLIHTKEMHKERISLLGKAIFSTDSPTKTIERIVHWLKKIEAFESLKNLGMRAEDIDRLIDMAISDEGGTDSIHGREEISRALIKEIYETAFNYKDLFRKA